MRYTCRCSWVYSSDSVSLVRILSIIQLIDCCLWNRFRTLSCDARRRMTCRMMTTRAMKVSDSLRCCPHQRMSSLSLPWFPSTSPSKWDGFRNYPSIIPLSPGPKNLASKVDLNRVQRGQDNLDHKAAHHRKDMKPKGRRPPTVYKQTNLQVTF